MNSPFFYDTMAVNIFIVVSSLPSLSYYERLSLLLTYFDVVLLQLGASAVEFCERVVLRTLFVSLPAAAAAAAAAVFFSSAAGKHVEPRSTACTLEVLYPPGHRFTNGLLARKMAQNALFN